jgi:hypothetical protein
MVTPLKFVYEFNHANEDYNQFVYMLRHSVIVSIQNTANTRFSCAYTFQPF